MVVKALSWALRALSIHEPTAVAKFIDTNEAKLARRVVREVRNRLERGLKNPPATR
jgi:3-methyladenine DNA glycosylase AlkD